MGAVRVGWVGMVFLFGWLVGWLVGWIGWLVGYPKRRFLLLFFAVFFFVCVCVFTA